eukprot:scaffold103782_cov30-Tisochrysis_lutea.AAC.3
MPTAALASLPSQRSMRGASNVALVSKRANPRLRRYVHAAIFTLCAHSFAVVRKVARATEIYRCMARDASRAVAGWDRRSWGLINGPLHRKAIFNAEANGITTADFLAGDASRIFSGLPNSFKGVSGAS